MKKILLLISTLFLTGMGFSQWVQKENFPGIERSGAIGFSIGSNGYFGLGRYSLIPYVYYTDFWEYKPADNTWTQRADFPALGRMSTVGFSIGSKGYVCGGIGGQPGNLVWYSDLWEYDHVNDTWTQKADFPGTVRSGAVGFSIGLKGYLGTGTASNDFWEYNPENDTWTQKADFPGEPRDFAVGFSNGNKGFIGTGEKAITQDFLKDFWEYDPNSNSWSQKADFGGGVRSLAVGFSIDTKGYIGTGKNNMYIYNDLWQYDDTLNSWTQEQDFPGIERIMAVGFSCGTHGYIVSGQDYLTRMLKDVYEFNSLFTGKDEIELKDQIFIYPNPANEFVELVTSKNGEIEILTLNCQVIKKFQIKDSKTIIDLRDLPSGFYIIKVKTDQGIEIKKLIKK